MPETKHGDMGAPAAERPSDAASKARQHTEDLLDQALEETFPASDPIAIAHDTFGLSTADGPRAR